MDSLKKTGTDEEFGEFELNMVELSTRWDQSSIDPDTRKLAQVQAAQLELDGKRVREDSMLGLVRRREEEEKYLSDSATGGGRTSTEPKKRAKNLSAKNVDKILIDLAEGMEEDKREMKEIEEKADQKHDDLMYGILGLTEEI